MENNNQISPDRKNDNPGKSEKAHPENPEKNVPTKPDKNPDSTQSIPGVNEPGKVDPTRIEKSEKPDKVTDK
jgi:hypothetical protein